MGTSQLTAHGARRRVGVRALIGTLSLALVVPVSVAIGAPAARADSLTDQQARLQQALAKSKQALSTDNSAANAAQQKLMQSQARLASQQQLLADATAATTAAAAQDRLLAAQLVAAQKALTIANANVAAGQKKLDAERKLAASSISATIQQANPLQNVALFTTNLGTADLVQRSQWADVSVTITQGTALRLAELQRQLQAAQKAQAAATATVKIQRTAAANHLQQTRTLQAERAAAAAAVAATVRLNAATAANAQAQVASDQAAHKALQAKAATVARQIAAARALAARRAAAAAAAARAARARAAAAAAAQAAANARAQRAAAAAAAAASRASNSSGSSGSSGGSSYTTSSSYAAAAGYGDVDPWGFYWGQCVSYAAWKVRTTTAWSDFVNNYTDRGTSVHFGNAVEWAAAAQALGIPVNTTPTVGSIAWRSSGFAGHVAYVTGVNSDGTINISEYNFEVPTGFDTRYHVYWQSGTHAGFDGFIHFESTRP